MANNLNKMYDHLSSELTEHKVQLEGPRHVTLVLTLVILNYFPLI